MRTCSSGSWSGTDLVCRDINECTDGTDNCSPQATCTNTAGGFTCACYSGFSGNGVSCTDINECTDGSNNCSPQASCTNTAGGFSCDCIPGYRGNGVSCIDIDECAVGTDNCSAQASCNNTAGGFTCACNPGYSGDGVTCADCVPDISLTGGGRSDSTAVKIARRTSFTIQSRITVICNQTYQVIYQWNVWGNVVQITDFPNKVVRDSQDITIPGNTLGYGLTTVELNATMVLSSGNKSQVQEQWVAIAPSPPVAHIAGGSAKSVSRQGVLVLNASRSSDPDQYIDDYESFTFQWLCETLHGTTCNDIFPDGGQSAVYELQAASFPDDVDIFIFTVEVSLDGRDSSQTSQSVTLQNGTVLNIAIRCDANCEAKASPSERLVLVTECDNCPAVSTTYQWTLKGENHIDWDVDTTTGNTSQNLVLRSNLFETRRFPPQQLPTGQELRDFNITLDVRVSDGLGASTIIRNIRVQVRPPSVNDTEEALGSLNYTLDNLLKSGDTRALLQLSNSLSSVLNAANTSIYSSEALSTARDGLINSMATIPVQSLEKIDQVSSALGQATASEEQVTPDSQSDLVSREHETRTRLVKIVLPPSPPCGAGNKKATKTTLDAIGKLNAVVLDQKVPGERPTTFSVGEFNLALEKQRCDTTADWEPHVFRVNDQSGTFFVVPKLSTLLRDNCDTHGSVGIENLKTPQNPYAFADTSDDVKSEVAGLQFSRNGSPLKIRDLTTPVEVFTRRLSKSPQGGQPMTELGTTEPSWKNTIRVNMRYFSLTDPHPGTVVSLEVP
ncbi:FBN1 [Branchiostoma lanceolatum]|uniref:FBN1 protein n=1 Tax=Branchiostoma lanceolatum TaxID=7740 RepID=A0A8K0ELR6_BRALA|nr:FBN1 [Branchiostoma lanceolatum]